MDSPEFKVGQRVQLVRANTVGGHEFRAGTIGTVLEVRARDMAVLLDEDTKVILVFAEAKSISGKRGRT
jgi:hypothetical protein